MDQVEQEERTYRLLSVDAYIFDGDLTGLCELDGELDSDDCDSVCVAEGFCDMGK